MERAGLLAGFVILGNIRFYLSGFTVLMVSKGDKIFHCQLHLLGPNLINHEYHHRLVTQTEIDSLSKVQVSSSLLLIGIGYRRDKPILKAY